MQECAVCEKCRKKRRRETVFGRDRKEATHIYRVVAKRWVMHCNPPGSMEGGGEEDNERLFSFQLFRTF